MSLPKPTYSKPALSLDQQVQRLMDRGMICDPQLVKERLAVVGYYRLSGYWHPFRQRDPANPGRFLDDFQPGTTFESVWMRYAFDRRLRLLILDAIERIEVCVRTNIALEHATRNGPFAYIQSQQSLPELRPDVWQEMVSTIQRDVAKSEEHFVKHYKQKYSNTDLPLWMVTEIVSLGCVTRMFQGCDRNTRFAIARPFRLHPDVLDSWLRALIVARNICAHHSRLWNRTLRVKPLIPNKDQQWHDPVAVPNDRVFAILTICKYCMSRIAPQSQWDARLRELLAAFHQIPLAEMGFPSDWETCPIWAYGNP